MLVRPCFHKTNQKLANPTHLMVQLHSSRGSWRDATMRATISGHVWRRFISAINYAPATAASTGFLIGADCQEETTNVDHVRVALPATRPAWSHRLFVHSLQPPESIHLMGEALNPWNIIILSNVIADIQDEPMEVDWTTDSSSPFPCSSLIGLMSCKLSWTCLL